MEEWPISKTQGQCFGTGKQIQPGEEFFAALVETPDGLQRHDFSIEFWENQKPDVYCFWKTKIPNDQENKKIFIDDEMLLSFFERLENETDQERINFRFVLALILMRKRKFKYDSSIAEGQKDTWRLRVVGENRFVTVIDPHLDQHQIEQLSSQLGQILQTDL